ncbi:hypothetical protein EDB85DRAFT_562845 [Lactarius pseudohatsudake]|nr:hypothetical protein EDB85DRAFT_562845 [Lactarius pseudohatsudake]
MPHLHPFHIAALSCPARFYHPSKSNTILPNYCALDRSLSPPIMIPLKANIQVQVPKGTTVELFALRKPFASLISSDRSIDGTPHRAHSLPPPPSQLDNLARGRAAARRRRGGDQSSPSVSTERSSIGKPNHSPQSSRVEPSNAIVASLRSELDATRSELTRFQSDATKLAEKYRILERVLQDAKDALRSRDKQIEDLKRERDFAMADRRSRGPVRDFDRRALRYDARRSSGTRSPSSRTAYDSDHDHDHDLDELPLMKSASPFRGRGRRNNLFLRFPDLVSSQLHLMTAALLPVSRSFSQKRILVQAHKSSKQFKTSIRKLYNSPRELRRM